MGGGADFFGVIIVLALVAILFFGFRNPEGRQKRRFERHRKALRECAHQAMGEVIEQHLPTLTKKAKQKIYVDDYGNTVMDDWDKEMEYFVINVIHKNDVLGRAINKYMEENKLRAKGQFEITPQEIEEAINSRVLPLIEGDFDQQTQGTMSGEEFEHLCAALLKKSGWDARVTKATGDQGIDVLAEREGVNVVLQCKRYSSPVGNKAVQEAFSGKEFEGADYAAVVSNADYTKSARQLANKNGVLLLHYDDLPNLWDQIGHGFA